MKTHTTNYTNTLIQIADDCPAAGALEPALSEKKTVARQQFELIFAHPYEYTSDDVIFRVYAKRNEIPESEWKEAREIFFSKGQPCLRTSPLSKKMGWGIHSDAHGKVALISCDSKEYAKLLDDPEVVKVKAMRSSK